MDSRRRIPLGSLRKKEEGGRRKEEKEEKEEKEKPRPVEPYARQIQRPRTARTHARTHALAYTCERRGRALFCSARLCTRTGYLCSADPNRTERFRFRGRERILVREEAGSVRLRGRFSFDGGERSAA